MDQTRNETNPDDLLFAFFSDNKCYVLFNPNATDRENDSFAKVIAKEGCARLKAGLSDAIEVRYWKDGDIALNRVSQLKCDHSRNNAA